MSIVAPLQQLRKHYCAPCAPKRARKPPSHVYKPYTALQHGRATSACRNKALEISKEPSEMS
jgi:hypothetical protein